MRDLRFGLCLRLKIRALNRIFSFHTDLIYLLEPKLCHHLFGLKTTDTLYA